MSLSGKSTTETVESLDKVVQSNSDLGLVRVLIDRRDKAFADYSYQSIIFDGTSNDTERTAGLPIGYAFDRVSFPTANGVGYTLYVASSSANDTAVGSGANKIFIKGLNAKWLEQTEEITLNGQTPVASVKTNWLRVNKIFVSQVQTNNNTNVGNISISHINSFTSGVPNNAPLNMITAGYGYSVVGIFSVPVNKSLYFTRGSYYTDASSVESLSTIQVDVYPWNPATPDTNRIKLVVGKLYSSTTTAFNTSGSVPESPATDIEFLAKNGKLNKPVNFSVFWNTIMVDNK